MRRFLPLLILAAVFTAGAAEAQQALNVRVTYYVDRGTTASGARTAPGVAACSTNFPFGTELEFSDGRVVTCLDRGRLGASGWLDVWMPSVAAGRAQVARAYGDYTTVTVRRWGYE